LFLNESTQLSRNQAKSGVILAILAYSMWGFAPMYFKLLLEMPAEEILVQRIVWSVVVVAILVVVLRHRVKVAEGLRNPKVIATLAISGLLLAGNWGVFIWAVNNDRLLDASLAYYINPMVNVFLGRLFLGEKLRPLQRLAVMMAVAGVSILVISFGEVPWIALFMACSFGLYGLLRKKVTVDSVPGMFIETSMMLPFAVLYWLFFATSASDLTILSLEMNLIIAAAGLVTTVPLLCFTAAARRIQYSTLGFFQYIGPSIMFLLAIFLYNEALQPERLITFGFVWSALVLFSFDSIRSYQQAKG
jgi:chloramphenicol-sensitive protein RarD